MTGIDIRSAEISALKIITPKKFCDGRGSFSETYNHRDWAEAGIDLTFVQDNHAYSADKGTLRGLHYQVPPMAQDKLVRVARGAILDVAVDLRRGSSTFRHHVSTVVSAKNWKQLLVPVGFAHGYLTLEPDTEVLYKTNNYYSPEDERGILWNDPDLGIDWGIDEGQVIVSERDRALPQFSVAVDFLECWSGVDDSA